MPAANNKTKMTTKKMNNNKDEIFSTEKVLAKEKELKEHPERNRVKTVSLTAEELYEKIMRNGGSYNIEGGILALKRAVDEEKKEKAKTARRLENE